MVIIKVFYKKESIKKILIRKLFGKKVFVKKKFSLKVTNGSIVQQMGTIPGQVVPLLIRAVPLLIWSVRSNSDYKATSVQLQLQLPIGTELGNMRIIN